MKKKKSKRFPDYEIIDTSDTITFGTSIWLRNDGQAIKIVFPCGDTLDFKPNDIRTARTT